MNPLEHHEIIQDLENRLLKREMIVFKYANFFTLDLNGENNDGEIDIYAINPRRNELIAIEVKRSRNWKTRRKACSQLAKELLFLTGKFPDFKIIMMHAYGEPSEKRKYAMELYLP
jgi:hypothetical protein